MPQLAKLFWRQFQTSAEEPGQIALVGEQKSFTEGHKERKAAKES
jgi:hypothetical protein